MWSGLRKVEVAASLSLATLLATACAIGSVVVAFSFDGSIGGVDQAGRPWQAAPHQVRLLFLGDDELSAFTSIEYLGERFHWRVGAGAGGIGGTITNISGSRICFGFNEASISSNFRPDPVPLRVFHVVNFADGKWSRIVGTRRSKQRGDLTAPPLCLAGGEEVIVSLIMNLQDVFPNKTLFNVRWPDGEPRLVDKGVGNWFRVDMPIEVDGKRESIWVTLTAKDSSARMSYH
jgi:hypothetical protein